MPNSKRRNGFSWRHIASSDGHVLAKLLHKFFAVSMNPRALAFTNLSYRLREKGLAISWSLAILCLKIRSSVHEATWSKIKQNKSMKQNGAAEHLYIRDQIFFWAHLLC